MKAVLSGRLKRLVSDEKKRVKLIAFIGIAAVLMIFLSEFLPKNSSPKESVDTGPPTYDTSYVSRAEERLTKLISSIEGAGKTELMLSVDGSEEYQYAEEKSAETESGGDEVKEKSQNKLFSDGNKNAVVKKIANPRFTGALVVCDGGGIPSVKERVIKAVSAALDLPASKICVECRKN